MFNQITNAHYFYLFNTILKFEPIVLVMCSLIPAQTRELIAERPLLFSMVSRCLFSRHQYRK